MNSLGSFTIFPTHECVKSCDVNTGSGCEWPSGQVRFISGLFQNKERSLDGHYIRRWIFKSVR